MDIKVAASPINWSNDDLPELGGDISFEQCIDEMQLAGFAGCEVGHKFPRDPKTLTKALSARNLQVASAWYSTFFTEPEKHQTTIDGFISHMQFLKAMNAKVIVVAECGHCTQLSDLPILKNKPSFSQKQWQLLCEGLDEIGEIAKENDMQIVYHPHMGTGVQSLNEIMGLMEQTNPESVALLLDTGHLHFAGVDSEAIILQYESRIKHVHLKDIRSDVLIKVREDNLSFLSAVKAGVFTVPGDGCIDFANIFAALKKIQYSGWFVIEAEQDPSLANPLVYAKKAREFVKNNIGI